MSTEQTLDQRLAAAVQDGAEIAAAISVVRAVPRPTIDLPRERNRLAGVLAAEVRETGRWPEDAGERWARIEQERAALQAHHDARHYAHQYLETLAAEAKRDADGPRLEVLRAEFDDVLDRVREHDAVLGPVRDAQGAIEAGPDAVAAWSALGVLVDRARLVLDRHRTVLAPDGDLGDVLATYVAVTPVPDASEGERILDESGRPNRVTPASLRRVAVEVEHVELLGLDELRDAQARRRLGPDGLPPGDWAMPTYSTVDEDGFGTTARPTSTPRRRGRAIVN